MTTYSSTVDTPAGAFTAVVDGDGAVLASGWTDDADALVALIRADLRGTDQPVPRRDLGPVTRAVIEYHRGELTAPDGIAVRQTHGGPFLSAGWKVLRDVGPGRPITYSELAARIGNPAAVRAAAASCGRNAAGLFVPCHRVIRTDGTLGGFRWGLTVKRWLLAHES